MICRKVPAGLRPAAAWPAGLRGGCRENAETQPRSNRSTPKVDFVIASPSSSPGAGRPDERPDQRPLAGKIRARPGGTVPRDTEHTARGVIIPQQSAVMSHQWGRPSNLIAHHQADGKSLSALTFPVADLQRECPGVSVDLIRATLKKLRAAGRVECLGRGQSSEWKRKARW